MRVVLVLIIPADTELFGDLGPRQLALTHHIIL